MKVIIMRGIPGSGKTTWVKEDRKQYKAETTLRVSADDHMLDRSGVYAFSPDKLPMAHRKCLAEFMYAMQEVDDGMEAYEVIYVDNTNLGLEEIAPYYAIAERYGAEVVIIDLVVNLNVAAERNVHGVSHEGVSRMLQRKNNASIPGRWNISIVDAK